MTQIFLITGFLGSGKTTFLTHLLTQDFFGTAPKGVLINEFGAIDVDGERLENQGITTTKLTNGSIFCACLKDDFTQSLASMLKKDLAYIFIESSGLADPSNVSPLLKQAAKLADKKTKDYHFQGSICIVDGKYFLPTVKLMVNVRRQIRQSGWVMVNKCDLIDKETRAAVTEKIRSIRPHVNIHYIEHGVFSLEDMRIPEKVLTRPTYNTIKNRPLTCSITLERDCTPEETEKLIRRMQEYFYRIKGSFLCKDTAYQVDSVYDTVEIRPATNPSSTTNGAGLLVCIASTGIRSVSAVSLACKEILKTGYHIET